MLNMDEIYEKMTSSDYERASSNFTEVVSYLTENISPDDMLKLYEKFIVLATVSIEKYPLVTTSPIYILGFIYTFKSFLLELEKEITILKNVPDIKMEFV